MLCRTRAKEAGELVRGEVVFLVGLPTLAEARNAKSEGILGSKSIWAIWTERIEERARVVPLERRWERLQSICVLLGFANGRVVHIGQDAVH